MSHSNSLKSKFAIGAFLIGTTMAAAAAAVAYFEGRNNLRNCIAEHLSSIRNAKSFHVENYFAMVRNHVLVYSESLMIREAATNFAAAFERLKTEKPDAAQIKAVQDHYLGPFRGELSKHVEAVPNVNELIPQDSVALRLQYLYLVSNPNAPESRSLLNDAGDGSEYSEVHRKFHPLIEKLRTRFGYGNVLIFETKSATLVYSSRKRISLGTSFRDGPFAKTSLANAVRNSIVSTDPEEVRFVDFETYTPEFGLPSAFMVTPIFEGDRVIAVIAFQIMSESLYRIVSDDDHWEQMGLGKTGEIILVGNDGLMRSESRLYDLDPESYVKSLKSVGMDEARIRKVQAFDSSVLSVQVRSNMTEQIAQGRSGTTIATDYMGREVLAAFAPLKFGKNGETHWGIVAKITTDEAFRPLVNFESNLLITLAGLGALSVFVAGLAGTALAAPIRKLTMAARAYANGFYDVRVNIESGDEVQELAETFNRMAQDIDEKTQNLKRKLQLNRRLLESMMPKLLFSKVRDHESSHASESSMATLAFIEIEGVEKLYDSMSAARAQRLMERLMESIDDTARKFGIEKISSGGATYLAACGLGNPVFDHTPKMMDFATELTETIVIFNAEYVTRLALSIGIHRGAISRYSSMQKSAFADLWIRTITLATDIEAKENHSAIRVSREVYERVNNNPKFHFRNEDQDSAEIAWTLISYDEAANEL